MKRFLVFLWVFAACTAAQQTVIKDILDVTGVACTATSIVLQDPLLGTVCTDASELLLVLAGWPKAEAAPITTHDLAAAVIASRKAKIAQ